MKSRPLFWAIFFGVGCLSLGLKIWTEQHLGEITRSISLKPLEASYHGHYLKRYSVGFDNLLTDLIWIQLLQRANHLPIRDNQVSWEFAQLDAMTTLDPKFERAYWFGASYLSVFRRDKLGARMLLEKWTKRRPDYWRTFYLLGYHLYFELGDYAAAAPFILRAASMERAPFWLTSLGVRLLSQTGALAQALRISIDLYSEMDNEEGQYRLRQRIRSLNFSLQKSAWETAQKKYRQAHHRSPASLEVLSSLAQQESQSLVSVINRREAPSVLKPILQEKFRFRLDPKSGEVVSERSPAELGIEKLEIYKPKGA